MNSILLAFLTGLSTGGISCIAVQGGLLTAALSQKKEKLSPLSTIGAFLVAKLISYTLLGFLLGLLGAKINISANLQGWMQIFAGVYLLATIGNLLNLHPIFRYVVIQPPKFSYKLLKSQTKAQSFFAPVLLGALTVLIPCGVTQAMIVYAIASANPWTGALIMAAFTLGTTPVFATIGFATSKLLKNKLFVYFASIVLFYLAISSINGGQVLRNSPHTLNNYWKVLVQSSNTQIDTKAAVVNTEGKQEVTIYVDSHGYTASANTLQLGVPVKLKLVTQNSIGCARAFTIPSLNISKVLPVNGEEIVEFTPNQVGILNYTCSMGMYTGSFTVVKS